jgi:DNA-binding MarR family transcriptional regulator
MSTRESRKTERIQRVIEGAREFSVGTVLFHHAVGEILGVNVTDMECLALIVYRGLSTPSELARYTGLSSGATTAMLDRLERSRLIKRCPNPQDRRGKLVVLTKDARQRLTVLFGSLRKAGNRLVSAYNDAELDVLADFFDKIAVIWKEEREKLQQR